MSTVRLPDGTEFEAADPLDAVDMALAYRAGEHERNLTDIDE